ncbi:MAG: hypothetical protein CSA65_03505 [Proteobacteria bacterium]|nr:MAG: hypothetical protein CSA65_03505 [Pseudomonadota bacterium]
MKRLTLISATTCSPRPKIASSRWPAGPAKLTSRTSSRWPGAVVGVLSVWGVLGLLGALFTAPPGWLPLAGRGRAALPLPLLDEGLSPTGLVQLGQASANVVVRPSAVTSFDPNSGILSLGRVRQG